MSEYFVVKNQHGQYVNKQKEWVDGSEPKSLFRTKHKDEAINLVVELSSKDIYLRAMAFACELNDKMNPIVEVCTTMPTISEDDNGDDDSSTSDDTPQQDISPTSESDTQPPLFEAVQNPQA